MKAVTHSADTNDMLARGVGRARGHCRGGGGDRMKDKELAWLQKTGSRRSGLGLATERGSAALVLNKEKGRREEKRTCEAH